MHYKFVIIVSVYHPYCRAPSDQVYIHLTHQLRNFQGPIKKNQYLNKEFSEADTSSLFILSSTFFLGANIGHDASFETCIFLC